MFPSPTRPNPFKLDHHHHQLTFKKSSSLFLCDDVDHQVNPISKQELIIDPPPFLFNLPSPIFEDNDLPLNQILSQSQIMAATGSSSDPHHNIDPNTNIPIEIIHFSPKQEHISHVSIEKTDTIPRNGVVDPVRRRNLGAMPRKRTGKKDRHSKICTAQGIRDRRMRLSLQVARKFFDLQDMLGYDKASKTIEWLFTKSKKAIMELSKDHPQGNRDDIINNNNNISIINDAKSESFLSECEGVSGIEENSINVDVKELLANIPQANVIKEGRKSRRNATYNKPNSMRESREKARERARCRTREKMMLKGMESTSASLIQWWKSNPNPDNVPRLGYSFDQESISSLNQERVSLSPPLINPHNYDFHHNQFSDEGTIEKLLQGNSSSSTTNSSCPNSDNFMGFLGNWDLLNGDRLSSTQYVTDQVPMAESPNSIYSNFPLFR